ncbi:MAG: EAL domain-containing protein [Epsilonproteobacteria bacterium]|nr:EAL domain-containing protein [Campylobacterota bacterium]NCO25485.1 EAL domain-containing protein [Campylobacterota bacterium]NCO29306.1 EAL domain-containing protein [Campylobacterota bacterium]NCS68762.1 EAL domain-containing protein [Campylobacterota bacterium]
MPIDILKDDLATALKKLQAKENSFMLLENITKLGSWEIDLVTKKSIWSDQSYLNYGYKVGEVEPTLELFLSHLVPEDLPRAQQTLAKIMQSGEVESFECRLTKESGETINLLLHGQVIYDEEKKPFKLIGTTQDVTHKVTLEKNSAALSELVEYSANEIYVLEYETLNILYANQSACKTIGYTFEELLGLTIFDINVDLSLEKVELLKKVYAETQKTISNRALRLRKDGTTYHVQSYIHELSYYHTKALVIFSTDITEIVQAEEQILKQSEQISFKENYDSLTSLPNRNLFQDRLSQSIIHAQHSNHHFALLFIDLDQFKKINDSLGHTLGDRVIIEVACRLNALTDSEDTVARLGGDEFAIILNNIKKIQYISAITNKIIDAIKEPIKIDAHTLYMTASIGISLYPEDSADANDLTKFADAAMYKAKDEGRNNFRFYSSEMTQLAFEKVIMENSLLQAIKENQFLVYFQPQYNVLTDKIIGMEALVRWRHPDLGIIPPGKFLSIAHESGLILEIDKIVMHEAMRRFAQWYRDSLEPGKLSLNLTMAQLNSKDFVSDLLDTMQKLDFQTHWLELEVLESHIMSNPEESIQKLNALDKLGINIAIDDFGTGYSSLSYLKKLPIKKLKIDRSFIMDIPHDEDDMAITKAIIALGTSLNLKIIAEGVEEKSQKEFLIRNGCYFIQGYLYSKPIPADEITLLLKNSSH